MVAPYDTGYPVRSYVRVVGSGWESMGKSSKLCDLSRVSSVAAAVPVRRTLPTPTPVRTLSVSAKQEALAPWNWGVGHNQPPEKERKRLYSGSSENDVQPHKRQRTGDKLKDSTVKLIEESILKFITHEIYLKTARKIS